MSLLLLFSCATPTTPDGLPVSPKAANRRPFSLGLDHLAEPGTWLRDDHDHDGWSVLEGDYRGGFSNTTNRPEEIGSTPIQPSSPTE